MPDPKFDRVEAIFYCYQNEDEQYPNTGGREGYHSGVIMIASPTFNPTRLGLSSYPILVVPDELSLFNALHDLVVLTFDPEVLVGFECQASSWGYLIDRAASEFEGWDFQPELGRIKDGGRARGGGGKYNREHKSAVKVTGRHVLNIWRMLKGEITLLQYTFENVAWNLLKLR